MKRFILLLLAFVLVSGLAGCKEKPVPGNETNKPEVQTESAELTELKDKIKADGKLIGVAYLGWLEGGMETACKDLTGLDYTKDFSFIKDINKYAENEGYRMYAIVPVDSQVTITVCKCEFDEEYLPYDGEEIDDDKILSVGLQSFHFKNMEDIFGISENEVKKNAPCKVLATSSMDVLDENLSGKELVTCPDDERWIILT